MNAQVAVVLDGTTRWRFDPFGAITADEVTTQREPQLPPVPPGSELWLGSELLGIVRCVRRAPFDRWTVVFDPPLKDVAEPDVEAVGLVDQDQDSTGTTQTPLSALDGLLDSRTLALLDGVVDSVEELDAMGLDGLTEISGIGAKRALDVQTACAAALGKLDDDVQ